MKVNDFKALGKLPDVYEMEPGKTYLVIADGKKFSHEAAQALLRSAEADGLSFHIIATLCPKALLVGTGTVTGSEGSGEVVLSDEQTGREGTEEV
jgi:hypothetical protein